MIELHLAVRNNNQVFVCAHGSELSLRALVKELKKTKAFEEIQGKIILTDGKYEEEIV